MGMPGDFRAPSFDDVAADMASVRRAGVGRLRGLPLPALHQAAFGLDLCDEGSREPAPVLELLRRAADTFGGGTDQEAVEFLLGLTPGTALWPIGRRRSEAAALLAIEPETLRKQPETDLLHHMTEGVLSLCHDARMRQTRLAMQERRHPADSRLTVQWVERFEAYYAIWTPAYALAADLEAALTTYLEEPSDHLPWDPDSTVAYDPVDQARGYARMALYHYAHFQLELKRFMTKHGGLWLASDAHVEQQIADAVYRIGWHNSFNEDDDAWLRRHLADARREEQDHFWSVVLALPIGQRIHTEWQDLVREGVDLHDSEREASQVWLTIGACKEYCKLIDDDWMRIADWYRPQSVPATFRHSAVDLYRSITYRNLQPTGIDPS